LLTSIKNNTRLERRLKNSKKVLKSVKQYGSLNTGFKRLMQGRYKRSEEKPSPNDKLLSVVELLKAFKMERHQKKASMRRKKKPGTEKKNEKTRPKCDRRIKIFGSSSQERTATEAVASTSPVI
jgi:hypothetical protein